MKDFDLYCDDCLTVMPNISSGSVDMILCDLPYGTTACKWDVQIDMQSLWNEYWRVLKPSGAVVLTAVQPFTTTLISSQINYFKYCWYWEKPKGANFALTGFQPLKVVEDIIVFSKSACTFTTNNNGMKYNAQKIALEKPYTRDFRGNLARKTDSMMIRGKGIDVVTYTHKTPRNLIYASPYSDGRFHPTQKPISLMEYLIRTYTNPGDVVLDNCMGVGTTGIACVKTERKFIGIELDKTYFDIACDRINSHIKQKEIK